MKKTLLVLCAVLAAVGIITGCSTKVPLSVDLELVALDGRAGTATVRFVNQGTLAYNLRDSVTRVTLDGKPMGTITIKQPVGIPSALAVEQSGVFAADPGVTLPSGSARYQLDMQVTVILYDENIEKMKLGGSGTVMVK